ncbi:allophanate hydrolase subunit 1 [Nocardioides sp.]|uniref:5-oxoprolinase subunit B family protein n=1 Tax=Nocardioides sp. TaxID=35761 RepID=UPI002737334E|nr:allophanate hydrolase subunit 1 [Nocardioides sp.]MDP3890690.1 allophanate hydrolase subunit 1 [Nocardioides sp.]
MRSRPAGARAVLIDVEDAETALSLASWARAVGVPATDIVPAASSVLFAGVDDPTALPGLLESWDPTERATPVAARIEVPVRYDGPDLDAVARHWQMTTAETVAIHTAGEYVVAFCGFAPGFAYLTGLPDNLGVPRLDTPRSRVEAGAVGLAGTFTGVYPRSSPGGWRILGHTDLVLWDQSRPEPALLVPGTRVRFVEQQ